MAVALKDQNSVASAIFESSTSVGVILRGKIDPITGRILVDVSGSSGGTLTWYNVSGTLDGANMTFTIPVSPASGIILVLARQFQMDTTDYSVSGSTITMTYAPDSSYTGQGFKAGVIS